MHAMTRTGELRGDPWDASLHATLTRALPPGPVKHPVLPEILASDGMRSGCAIRE
jgi:hypothetical protein